MEKLKANGFQNPTSTSDNERSPLERLQAEVEMYNKCQGTHKELDCPICLDRGYVAYVDAESPEPCIRYKDCKCMTRFRNSKRIERSGLKDLLSLYTFDSWKSPEKWQAQAKERAMKYAEQQTGWFLAAGNSGSGKTHLCTAICSTLLNSGVDVRYVLWRDMSVQAKAAITDDTEYERITRPLKTVKALYIDDLFKTGKGQQPTTGDVNLAFEILNYRYNDPNKLTIISTERSISELMDIDEATGSRIYERSKGFRLDMSDKQNWRKNH